LAKLLIFFVLQTIPAKNFSKEIQKNKIFLADDGKKTS